VVESRTSAFLYKTRVEALALSESVSNVGASIGHNDRTVERRCRLDLFELIKTETSRMLK
jgi:hypothetical protein